MKKVLGAGAAIVVLVLGWWAVRYLGVFESNPLSQSFDITSPSLTPDSESVQAQTEPVELSYETVAEGLMVPWDIVFTSEDRILVTERLGRIRAIVNGRLQEQPLITFPEVSSRGEEGLMGLALDPEYGSNKYLYACYAYPTEVGYRDRVVRLIDNGDQITVDQTIIENIPAATFHAGCAIAFGPDDKLYITTGDAGQRQLAQRRDSLAGKILRLNPDGTIPRDNPFPNSPVWSLGHRNPQGIDWYPGTDVLYESEHGPSVFDGPAGGDEINIIRKGENYGWPVVHHQESQSGMINPALVFTPAIAPASGSFYSGTAIPQYSDNFMVGMLQGEGILFVKPNPQDPTQIQSYEQLKLEYGRVRAVVGGPDEAIYFSTSNQDGRGDLQSGDDKIVRIRPAN